MKRILFALLTFLVVAINASAQTSNKKEMKHRKQMMKELQLSKEQKKEIKQMRKPVKQEKADIQNDASLTPQQKQEKLKQLRMDQMQKLNAVLTPEQKEKLKTQVKEKNPRRGVTNMPNEKTAQ